LLARGWTVVLAAGDGALLSHHVAGWLHKIDGVPAYSKLDVSVPWPRRPRAVTSANVHRVNLTRADAARAGGLPVTAPIRTVIDLARVVEVSVGARILGDALRTGMAVPELVEQHLALVSRKHGAARARTAFQLADPRLESILEHELLDLVLRLGLRCQPQYEIFGQGRFLARVDLAIPELKLAIEADGYATHAMRPGFERDRERWALLQAAGWTVLAFTATQIRQRRSWVLDVIAQTVARLAAA
jgi:very-short-patch-repair endonuclease